MKPGTAPARRDRRDGWLQIDLAVATAILLLALVPLAHSVVQERKLCRSLYFRSVAMAIVDGEMEILRAGRWRSFGVGEHEYPVGARSASQLPPGAFLLERGGDSVRLRWQPEAPWRSSGVSRLLVLDPAP